MDREIWKTIAIEIPEDGEYTIVSWAEEDVPGSRVVVEECSMRCDAIVLEQALGFDLPIEPVWLRAGRYALRLTRPEEAGTNVAVVVSGGGCG